MVGRGRCCRGSLHAGHYGRKPRGLPAGLEAQWLPEFSVNPGIARGQRAPRSDRTPLARTSGPQSPATTTCPATHRPRDRVVGFRCATSGQPPKGPAGTPKPTYTFRPRNLTDGGVVRRRQCPQHKLQPNRGFAMVTGDPSMPLASDYILKLAGRGRSHFTQDEPSRPSAGRSPPRGR